MFTWYNKNATKNTITRYLSLKYSPAELTQITHLELPNQFDSLDYANELNQILLDSPWKASEVKYLTNNWKNLTGVFTKDYWFGKKTNSQPDWKNIDSNFTKELINDWESNGFTYEQTQEWIDIGFGVHEAGFCAWIRDSKQLTAEDVLNYGDINQLISEFEGGKTPSKTSWDEYTDNNPFAPLAQETDSDTSSVSSDSSQETIKFNPHRTTVNEEETSNSDSASEITYQGTYRYEFTTDNQGLIIGWRTPSSYWQEAETWNCKDKYLATDIAQYANSYLRVKTLAPLPHILPESKVLFTPCQDEKQFYNNEPNWTNCYIWTQEPLRICQDCGVYLEPISNKLTVNLCAECGEKREEKPSKNFWDNNKNLLIIAGITVLIVIIYQNN